MPNPYAYTLVLVEGCRDFFLDEAVDSFEIRRTPGDKERLLVVFGKEGGTIGREFRREEDPEPWARLYEMAEALNR